MKHYVDNATVRGDGFQRWVSRRSIQPATTAHLRDFHLSTSPSPARGASLQARRADNARPFTSAGATRKAMLALAIAAAWGWHAPLAAGDFNIAQSPLTAATVIAPNLVYIHDDSSSMTQVFLPGDAVGPMEGGAYLTINGVFQKVGYIAPVDATGKYVATLASEKFGEPARTNLLLSSSWNGMAYNPEVTYPPPYEYKDGKLKRMPNSDTLTKYPEVRRSGYTGDGATTEKLGVGINDRAGQSTAYTDTIPTPYFGNGASSDITGPISHDGYKMGAAIYWDYVPGYHSMRDNPKYKKTYSSSPNNRLEDDKYNYEYYAFQAVPEGALFRANNSNPDLFSRTAAHNRALVISRACPTVFPDVMESREYYGKDNPHGQCRVYYRTKGPTDTEGVGYTFNGTTTPNNVAYAFAHTTFANSPNGRPWCSRSNGSANLTNGVSFGNANPGTPLVWQPYGDKAQNYTATDMPKHLTCYAGRHVIGDINGDGVYDQYDKDHENEYVSYFEYSGQIMGSTLTKGTATEMAEANCMPKAGQQGVCTNLYGPEQSRLHLVTSHVGDDGEVVEYPDNPRRRTGKEEVRNFMNWFTYYRSRTMAAKAGMSIAFAQMVDKNDTTKPSALMNNQVVRLGYDTINSSSMNGVNTTNVGPAGSNRLGKGVRPFVDFAADAKTPDGKVHPYKGQKFVKEFYDWVLGRPAGGTTPLISALKSAGKYYESDAPWMDYPPVPGVAASGDKSSCRRSVTILMTDGYSGQGSSPGCSATGANSTGCYDNTPGAELTWPNGEKKPTYTPQTPFADPDSRDSLADWAMYYWKTDLQTKVDNNIAGYTRAPSSGSPNAGNPAFWQHMQTYTIGLGAQGPISEKELKAYLGKKDNWGKPVNSSAQIKWGKTDGLAARTNDLFHAAINGRGNFYDTRDAKEFGEGLMEIMTSLAGEPTSQVSYAGAGGRGAEADDMAYQASYNPGDWSGNIAAYRLCSKDTIGEELLVEPGANQRKCTNKLIGGALAEGGYRFADQFRNQVEATNGVLQRQIFTWNGQNGIEFRGEIAGVGSKLFVDYLRGEKSLEIANGGTFRNRSGQYLGDVVNSTPYLLGNYGHNDYGYGGYKCDVGGNQVTQLAGSVPNTDACKPHETSFLHAGEIKDYQKRMEVFKKFGRRDTLFVASNNGMLHAFRGGLLKNHPDAGTEIFAYVPGAIHGELNQLGKQTYQHQYFVDGTPWVGDIILDGKWKSVLVGSTGRAKTGEKYTRGAFFALDVEEPAFFDGNKVLWEFTDDDLGAPVDIDPVIVAVTGGGGHRWAAVFGNGYNSKNGRAGLFIVPLEKDGHLKAEFIPVPAFGGNGLGSPYLIDSELNGLMDYAYAGDAQGNLWKFDLASRTAEKVMEARDRHGLEQAISAPPTVQLVDPRGPSYGYQLIVGTGKFFEESDLSNMQVQSIYGVRMTKSGNATNNGLIAKRSNMQVRVYDGKSPTQDTFYPKGVDTGIIMHPTWKLHEDENNNPLVNYPDQSGYVIDLDQKGMEGALVRVQGTLYTGKNFFMPIALPSAEVCSGSLAGGYAEFDVGHGTWLSKRAWFSKVEHGSNVWRHPGTTGAELNRDGKYEISDVKEGPIPYNRVLGARYGLPLKKPGIVTANPEGGGTYEVITGGGRAGRQSWRQLR